MSERSTGRSTLTRVLVPKPHDVLADRLREAILSEMEEGSRLPTEQELMHRSGLGRTSVREAMRRLEAEGLIQPRPARLGGNIVSRPGNNAMAHFILQFVRGRKLSLRALQETRETIEPALARLAAENRTDEDLARLHQLNEALADESADMATFAAINADFHNAIGAASGNDLLEAFLFAISFAIIKATVLDEYHTVETRREVVRVHARILDAIEARDGAAAFRRMNRHVQATRERVKHSEDFELPIAPSGPSEES